MYMVKISKQFD